MLIKQNGIPFIGYKFGQFLFSLKGTTMLVSWKDTRYIKCRCTGKPTECNIQKPVFLKGTLFGPVNPFLRLYPKHIIQDASEVETASLLVMEKN